MRTFLVITTLVVLILGFSNFFAQRGVEQEKAAILEEVRKDSPRIDYAIVCAGVAGAESAEIARQNGRCN